MLIAGNQEDLAPEKHTASYLMNDKTSNSGIEYSGKFAMMMPIIDDKKQSQPMIPKFQSANQRLQASQQSSLQRMSVVTTATPPIPPLVDQYQLQETPAMEFRPSMQTVHHELDDFDKQSQMITQSGIEGWSFGDFNTSNTVNRKTESEAKFKRENEDTVDSSNVLHSLPNFISLPPSIAPLRSTRQRRKLEVAGGQSRQYKRKRE
jgi:hypothetical protein